MTSIADLLSDMPENMYPRWFEGSDRIQYMPGEGRYAMLLPMESLGHWCCYVLVPNRESIQHLEGKALRGEYIWPLNFSPRISYSGPGSRQISWRWYNSSQQLKTLVPQLQPDGDWWIGFDTLDHRVYQLNFMREYMIHFEHYIHEILHDHPAHSR